MIALNIVGLNEIEKQIVAIYVYGIFPKIRKNIQHRYVMHCVSDEILAQLKAKSPMLFEELRSNLVEEVCSDSDD